MVTREQILEEAEKLIGVKWLDKGRIPKFGIDCVGVISVIGVNLGLVAEHDRADYPRRPNQTFLKRFREGPLIEIVPNLARPGDVLVYTEKTQQCHSGIMATLYGEPAIIHAYAGARKVTKETLEQAADSVGICTHVFKFPNIVE